MEKTNINGTIIENKKSLHALCRSEKILSHGILLYVHVYPYTYNINTPAAAIIHDTIYSGWVDLKLYFKFVCFKIKK